MIHDKHAAFAEPRSSEAEVVVDERVYAVFGIIIPEHVRVVVAEKKSNLSFPQKSSVASNNDCVAHKS